MISRVKQLLCNDWDIVVTSAVEFPGICTPFQGACAFGLVQLSLLPLHVLVKYIN